MVISLRRLLKSLIGIAVLVAVAFASWLIFHNVFHSDSVKLVMGGHVYPASVMDQEMPQPTFNAQEQQQETERFQRPSKQPALKLKYVYSHNEKFEAQSPLAIKAFDNSGDVVQAYFAFLEQAENMNGYCGGCGSVGYGREPYPHAYELLSRETRENMPLDSFIASFLGTGHTTLLKLIPAYAPPGTPATLQYYLVEFEIITGPKCSDIDGNKPQPTYFAYYFGLITTEQTVSEGWKIKAMNYIPEDFLCAPYHMWYWDSPIVVRIIFGQWYNLIDGIEQVDVQGPEIKIYTSGGENKYRFDALRLTNGEDIFLHEYVWENGKWKEVDYIVEKQKYLKFSILKFQHSDAGQ